MQEDQGITRAYETAKAKRWDELLTAWSRDPAQARACSRFRKSTIGWTFLHQAAYFGHEVACRALIRVGAAVAKRSVNGETAAGVAKRRGHAALAAVLRRAAAGARSVWSAPTDPDLLPCSCLWGEAVERRASQAMQVAYAGGVVDIPAGRRYYADSFERVLIGWHGSYDPPCGMDDRSMVGD